MDCLQKLGVTIGAHARFGRADVVAEHGDRGTVVVEVEGDSSRQREQAMYSALGQALLVMRDFGESISYAIAVPDREDWLRQLRKVPFAAAERLKLKLWAVSSGRVREVIPESRLEANLSLQPTARVSSSESSKGADAPRLKRHVRPKKDRK